MLNRCYVLLFLFLPGILSAQAPNVEFEHFLPNEGLSESQVNCILQDREGFLWICTFDGLNRYDGRNFLVYYHDPFDNNTIASNDLYYMIEDKNGFLWICVNNEGVDILDKSTGVFRHLINEPGYPKSAGCENIESIFEDSYGDFWLCTHMAGLIKYNPGKNTFEHFKNSADPFSISNDYVRTIIEDDTGNLWIGTTDGLNIYDRQNKKFINYKNPDEAFLNLKENYISKLYIDKQKNLWVGANHYLVKYDRSKNMFQNIDIKFEGMNEAQGYRIWSILKDNSGILWLGTTRGLIRYDEGKNNFTIHRQSDANPTSLSNNYLWTNIRDNSGNMWLGTDLGLNKFNTFNKKFLHIGGKKSGTPFDRINYVWEIFQDSRNNIWIGTDTGLYRWDRKNNTYVEFKHNPKNKSTINSDVVYTIREDSQNNIWILTISGLDRYDYNSNSFFHYYDLPGWTKYIKDNVFYEFYIDSKGIIWIGVFDVGVVKINPADNSFNILDAGSSNEVISCLKTPYRFLEDREHNMWIGTEDGLMKYSGNEKRFIVYKHDQSNPKSISSNKIMSIMEDHKGNLWIGSDGEGLNFFDKKKEIFKSYFIRNGLPSNTIYGILEDNSGAIWVSTNNGLSKLNPLTMEVTNFDVTDGLQGKEFNAGSYFKNKQGEMFFGGINGFNIFHPDSIKYNNYIPNVVITEIKILNKRINEAPVLHSGVLELSYSQNFISFQFAALDFTSPYKNRYKYRMVGFDKNWVDAANKPWADYTNLDPGEYTFKVIGSNNDGVWNNMGTSLLIIVHPPYWMSWWFRSLIIGILLLMIWYAFHRRVSNLKKETAAQQRFSRQLIDSQENERKRMASELHDGIGQNLLIINNRAKMAVKKTDFDAAKQQIESISEIALESINDVRKIAYNLHPYHLDELGLSKTIKSIIDKSFESSGIKVTQSIDFIDNIFKPETEIHIFRIIQEGISNIIKHSAAKNVGISVKSEAGQIIINISDDGKGMSGEFIEHSLKSSKGFGLKGMQERIRLINGNFKINTYEGKGTTIIVTVPVNLKNEKYD